MHTKPRKALFTPLKIPKGPSSVEKLSVVRFIKGVMKSGKVFEFHDNWQDGKNAHRVLDEPWVGCTTFVVEDKANLMDVQLGRDGAQEVVSMARLRWCDILEE